MYSKNVGSPWGLHTPALLFLPNFSWVFIWTDPVNVFAADSIGLCLLLFAQLSLNVEPSESKTPSTKTEFYMI